MKYIVIFLILISNISFAQSKLPNSIVNIGVGLGANYGGIGINSVIGYRNSGLLIGIGYFPYGAVGYNIGGQISYKKFYANMGLFHAPFFGKTNYRFREMGNSASLGLGYMAGLGKTKRLFVDLGLAYFVPFLEKFSQNFSKNLILNLGVGYRFGNRH